MNWFKKNKWKVILPAVVVAILVGAFWYGGNAPGLQGWSAKGEQTVAQDAAPAPAEKTGTAPKVEETKSPTEDDNTAEKPEKTPKKAKKTDTTEKTNTTDSKDTSTKAGSGLESRPGGTEGGMSAQEKINAAASIAGGSSPGVAKGDKDYSEANGMVIDPSTGKDKYLTDPVPEGKPLPVEPQDATITDTAHTCTLSISCATILKHMDWLDPDKVELVPEDGWILAPTTVTFYEGESVFNVLQRTCKQQKIHMEFENTPMYNSAYIEGIHNLYEFDCGELSGWMYKVNDWFPNYGCSRYQLHEGDVINWVYTCDLGVDVGGFYSTGG